MLISVGKNKYTPIPVKKYQPTLVFCSQQYAPSGQAMPTAQGLVQKLISGLSISFKPLQNY